MTIHTAPYSSWSPILHDILQVLEDHNTSLSLGEGVLAYALGYARGLQQRPIMDQQAIENIHLGWAHGASIEVTEFIREGESKS